MLCGPSLIVQELWSHATSWSIYLHVYFMSSFTLEQNTLIASGGKPLRRNAVKVNNLGSSQSLKVYNSLFISQLKTRVNKQTNKQTHKQTHKQTDRQTNKNAMDLSNGCHHFVLLIVLNFRALLICYYYYQYRHVKLLKGNLKWKRMSKGHQHKSWYFYWGPLFIILVQFQTYKNTLTQNRNKDSLTALRIA